MGRMVTLLQDCYVETRHHSQVLDNGIVAAGEQIELLSGNGYHTVVKSARHYTDETIAKFNPDNLPDAEVKGAENRMLAAIGDGPKSDNAERVYGKLYD